MVSARADSGLIARPLAAAALAFGKATDKEIAHKIVGRRAGDIAQCYANPAKALSDLGWKAQHGLDEMCEDTWRWQKNNPNGFAR